MSRQVSPSANRAYGVLRVARVWAASRATLYRHRRSDQRRRGRRPGPVGAMPDEALVAAIRQLLAASLFHGEGHRKVWARLRFARRRIWGRAGMRSTPIPCARLGGSTWSSWAYWIKVPSEVRRVSSSTA